MCGYEGSENWLLLTYLFTQKKLVNDTIWGGLECDSRLAITHNIKRCDVDRFRKPLISIFRQFVKNK